MRALSVQLAMCFVVVALVATMGPVVSSVTTASAGPAVDAPMGDTVPAPAVQPVVIDNAASPPGTTEPVLTFLASDLMLSTLPALPAAVAAAPATTGSPPAPTTPLTTDPCAPKRPLVAPALIKTGPKDRPRVAVTIDDTFGASGAKNVAAVLDVAKTKGARLTFFPTGGAFDDHDKAGLAGVWKRVVADGHEIGNHTYSHWNLLKLGETDIQDELDSTQGRLDQILGFHYEMHLMRPPGGNGGYPTNTPDPTAQECAASCSVSATR